MRFALAVLATLALGSSFSPAQAQDYPWCAEYGGSNGGRNCGFVSLQQCRAAISGDTTGSCIPNGFYADRKARR